MWFERENQCVVDRCLAKRFDAGQRLFEHRNAVCKIAIQPAPYHRSARQTSRRQVALADERESRRVQAFFAGLDAAAVVDHQPQADGKSSCLKTEIFCSDRSSKTRKFSFVRLPMGWSFSSVTLTCTSVRSTFTLSLNTFPEPKGLKPTVRNEHQTLHFHHHHPSTGAF